MQAGQTLPLARGQQTASRHMEVFQGERRQSKTLCLEASAALDLRLLSPVSDPLEGQKS